MPQPDLPGGRRELLLWTVLRVRRLGRGRSSRGLAYLFGLAVVSVLLVVELVLGVPFGAATVVVTAFGVAAGGLVAGACASRVPAGSACACTARWAGLIALGAALMIVFLEAVFRAGRLAGLFEWDAMSFWVPKAKVIYSLGGLDERFFLEIPGQSYPPLVPGLQASAFSFMGSADVVTVHVLFWFPLAGFVAAVAGLLAPRVPALLLWPGLLLVVLTPEVVASLSPQADLLLDYFIALAALLMALWLLERWAWQLVLAATFLSAAMLTKREGYLLVACVVAAAVAASWRDRGGLASSRRSPRSLRLRRPSSGASGSHRATSRARPRRRVASGSSTISTAPGRRFAWR